MQEIQSQEPYRRSSFALVPIHENVVPDCGRKEMDEVVDQCNSTRQEIRYLKEAPTSDENRVASFVFATSVGVLVTALLLFDHFGLELQYACMLAGAYFCISIPLGIKLLSTGAHKTLWENLHGLEDKHTQFKARLSRLQSLEELTGKRARANELTQKVRNYNYNLKSLEGLECSMHDYRLIDEKRQALLSEIEAFRLKFEGNQD